MRLMRLVRQIGEAFRWRWKMSAIRLDKLTKYYGKIEV